MKVHKSFIVSQLESHYKNILTDLTNYPNIQAHLHVLAQRMWEGLQTENSEILREISNYHSNYLGKTNKEIIEAGLILSDCRHTIANEHGYKDWEKVEALGNTQYNFEFEKTVNILLNGEFEKLKNQISKYPRLLFAKSKYGHQATLLHYVASNGVEMWRQKVPMNLVEITEYLLKQGADKNAKMKVYGGEFDVYSLLVTSAHPASAGLMEEMKKILA